MAVYLNKLEDEGKSISSVQENIYKNEIKLIKISGILPLLFIPSLTLLLLIILNISISVLEIKLTLIITFSIAFFRLLPTIINIQSNFNNLIKFFPSSTLIRKVIIESSKKSENIFIGKKYQKLKNGIKFHNVFFSYENRKKLVIKNLSFTIKAKTIFGIFGQSGSGKSTLVEMLSRIISPEKGFITFDDINIKNISLKSLRSSLVYLPQEPLLFNTSIRENMKFIDKNLSDQQIWRALKMAKAYDFVKSFPEKLETKVGQMGKNLSGGQKQRIVLARAFLQKPDILILDEPTSALDTNTESYIQKVLRDFKNEMKSTIILISHRPSAILKCDNFISIDNSKLNRSNKS